MDEINWKERYDAAMATLQTLQVKLDAALQKHADDATAQEAALKAALQAQAETLATKHAEEIAALKASVLVPALKDWHARQAAELAAKQAAELDMLK